MMSKQASEPTGEKAIERAKQIKQLSELSKQANKDNMQLGDQYKQAIQGDTFGKLNIIELSKMNRASNRSSNRASERAARERASTHDKQVTHDEACKQASADVRRYGKVCGASWKGSGAIWKVCVCVCVCARTFVGVSEHVRCMGVRNGWRR